MISAVYAVLMTYSLPCLGAVGADKWITCSELSAHWNK